MDHLPGDLLSGDLVRGEPPPQPYIGLTSRLVGMATVIVVRHGRMPPGADGVLAVPVIGIRRDAIDRPAS